VVEALRRAGLVRDGLGIRFEVACVLFLLSMDVGTPILLVPTISISDKFIMKVYSIMYLMILIMYYKY
jgi:hypothetical protein